MFKLMKTMVLSTVCVVGSQSIAQELNPSIPTYHPSCNAVFESAGLKVLTSSDCSSIFLAPADVGVTTSKVVLNGNSKECRSLKINRDELARLRAKNSDLNTELLEALDNGSDWRVKRVREKIAVVSERMTKIKTDVSELASKEGAFVNVKFNNEVRDVDVKRFVETNAYLFQNIGYMPRIEKVTIKDSVYSFNFVNEPIMKTEPIILGTGIPGLEVLNQVGAQQTRVAQILQEGPISGFVEVSLNGVCTDDEESGFINTDGLGNLLVVNRKYNIETLSEYGYKATLDVTRITQALGNRFSTSTNHGYTQREINNIVYSNEFEDDFHIEFYEGHEPESPLLVQEITNAVLDRLVTKYMAELENVDLIEVTGYEDYVPAQGGIATVQQTGRTCKRKWYGSKRCWDTVYNVKKWIDGYSELTVDEYSKVQHIFTESMNVQDIVKKPMGSTFSSIELN